MGTVCSACDGEAATGFVDTDTSRTHRHAMVTGDEDNGEGDAESQMTMNSGSQRIETLMKSPSDGLETAVQPNSPETPSANLYRPDTKREWKSGDLEDLRQDMHHQLTIMTDHTSDKGGPLQRHLMRDTSGHLWKDDEVERTRVEMESQLAHLTKAHRDTLSGDIPKVHNT